MESCDTICIPFLVLQNSGKLVQTLVLGSKSELYLKLKECITSGFELQSVVCLDHVTIMAVKVLMGDDVGNSLDF